MKVFDICLGVVRVILILDILREIASLGELALRIVYFTIVRPGDTYLIQVENSYWINDIFALIVSFILLSLTRPMARLAANFAAAKDSAQPF